MTVSIPADLRASVTRLHGDAGQRWLASIPQLINSACQNWDLSVDDTATMHGGLSLVLSVHQGDRPAILKLMQPPADLAAQTIAMRAVAATARPLIYAADADHGTVLLERLSTQTLATVSDVHEAIAVAGRLTRAWAVSAPEGIRRLDENPAAWATAIIIQNRNHHIFNDQLITQATDIITSLGSAEPNLLIHGGLYQPNILRSSRGSWVAIDPDPWIGPPAFDAATVICDRLELIADAPDPQTEVRERLHTFAAAANVDEDYCRQLTLARVASGVLTELDKNNHHKAHAMLTVVDALTIG